MISHADRVFVIFALGFTALLLAGCGKATVQSPPKQQVQSALAAVLPTFLSVADIETEPIQTGVDSVKVNFKATVSPKENLCVTLREIDGTPKITLLRVAQAAGAKLAVYGFVDSHRLVDMWTLEAPQIQTGLSQLGKPKGDFSAQSYIDGSDEAFAAQKLQADNAEAKRQAKEAEAKQREADRLARQESEAAEEEAKQARQEKARIAFEKQQQKLAEQRKKIAEAQKEKDEEVKQKLLLATAPGMRYIGTKTEYDNTIQRVALCFTDQDDFIINANVGDPDTIRVRKFTGRIIPSPEPTKEGFSGYPIILSGLGGERITTELLDMYTVRTSVLHFRLNEDKLEGYVDLGMGHTAPILLKPMSDKEKAALDAEIAKKSKPVRPTNRTSRIR